MHEQILALAVNIAGASETDQELLSVLCSAAEAAWTARLRQGVTTESCGETFYVAAAFTAAADFLSSQGGGSASVESFTAGEISIRRQSGTDNAGPSSLRQTAERLMAPYAAPEGFVFKGVRG